MKLYVCYTTAQLPRPGGHPCANAHKALRAAGHDPEVVHALGLGGLPRFLQTGARKEVREHTGKYWVPALETDEGEWIGGSQNIVKWAEDHPAVAVSAAKP
jgi:hypothetical protein